MAVNPVTDYDRRIVREMWTDEYGIMDIALKLRRNHSTIQHIANMMGLGKKPTKPAPSEWTDEMVEFLRVSWFEGATATGVAKLINAKFGTRFTRNATIGKIHRSGFVRSSDINTLNIRRSGQENIRHAQQRSTSALTKSMSLSFKKGIDGKVLKTEPKTPIKTAIPNPKASYGADDNIREAWVIVTDAAWDILPGSEPKTLLNRRNFGECKYPVGIDEPEQRFCCVRTAQTYCEAHRRIMYRPPTKGERDTLRPRHIMRAASR